MNPFRRWVNKIIQFFRPAPAPVKAPEAPVPKPATPAPEKAKEIAVTEVISPKQDTVTRLEKPVQSVAKAPEPRPKVVEEKAPEISVPSALTGPLPKREDPLPKEDVIVKIEQPKIEPVLSKPEPKPSVTQEKAPEVSVPSALTGPLPKREDLRPREDVVTKLEAKVEPAPPKPELKPSVVAEAADETPVPPLPKREDSLPKENIVTKIEEPKIEPVLPNPKPKSTGPEEAAPETSVPSGLTGPLPTRESPLPKEEVVAKIEPNVEPAPPKIEPEPALIEEATNLSDTLSKKDLNIGEKQDKKSQAKPVIAPIIEVASPTPKPEEPAPSKEPEVKPELLIELAAKPEPLPPHTPEPKPFETKVAPKILETLTLQKSEPLPEWKSDGKPVFTGQVELTPGLDNPARLKQTKGVISVNDIANRELLDLVPYEPGKPVDDVARELGLDPAAIIKLASNENPLGPSPLAQAAMHKAIETSHFYPDGGGFHLRNAIATAFDLGRENVVLGNGSNEIIELLFHTFTRPGIHEIVTARHAFAVYTLMAQLFGVHAIEVDDKDFTPDLPAMLKAITPQTRLVFLASPNNPTGTRVSNEALDAFMRDLPPHVIAVLDEAYYEFLDNPPDTVGYVKAGKQVVLMRTFSKIQGLAGLRIGYGLAAAELANLLQRARQPFNANLIAQAGAMAGLADIEHQKKTKAITDEGRKLIEAAFAQMELQYVPSAANFVMVNVGDGGEVFKRLMKKGIIVRSMVSYHLAAYIRVSIGTTEQNKRFLEELPVALEGLVEFKRA